ncbi:lysophospholipid acyltransferase family protein [bacterium]|nr:lysophospholipid acyltransferase family protein [bacterium]
MIVHESLKRDIARLVIWYPVRWLIMLMPVKISFAFFRFLGRTHYFLGQRSLDGLRQNIKRTLKQEHLVESALKTYLENHYLDRLHIFTYPRLHKNKELNTVCRIEGLQNLESVLKKKSGAIITLGHAGPIQLPLFHLGYSGYPVIQIGLPTDEGLSWIGRNVAFRLRLKYEAMIPVRILPANRFLRPLFKHLKQNGVVMMNIDPAGGGRWIGQLSTQPFLGAHIPFPLGSAILSAKTGAPVLPMSISQDKNSIWRCKIHPPINFEASGNEEQFIAELASWYQDRILEDPGLWHFWDEFEPGKLIMQL